ncbi:MAG: hypothetical protein ABI867_25405 [Kofleriaceae bacterium]
MKPAIAASALLSVLCAGCPAGGGYYAERANYRAQFKQAPRFDDYLADIMSDAAKNVTALDANLTVTAPITLPESPLQRKMFELVLARTDANNICFQHEHLGAPISMAAEEVARTLMTRRNEYHFNLQAITSLEQERGRPLFPPPAGGSPLSSVEVLKDEVRDVDNRDRGTVERKRAVTFLVCAKRPAITAETKYLAITLHDDSGPAAPDEYDRPDDGESEQAKQLTREEHRRKWLRNDVLYLISVGAP